MGDISGYVVSLYITSEQENAIRSLFKDKNWPCWLKDEIITDLTKRGFGDIFPVGPVEQVTGQSLLTEIKTEDVTIDIDSNGDIVNKSVNADSEITRRNKPCTSTTRSETVGPLSEGFFYAKTHASVINKRHFSGSTHDTPFVSAKAGAGVRKKSGSVHHSSENTVPDVMKKNSTVPVDNTKPIVGPVCTRQNDSHVSNISLDASGAENHSNNGFICTEPETSCSTVSVFDTKSAQEAELSEPNTANVDENSSEEDSHGVSVSSIVTPCGPEHIKTDAEPVSAENSTVVSLNEIPSPQLARIKTDDIPLDIVSDNPDAFTLSLAEQAEVDVIPVNIKNSTLFSLNQSTASESIETDEKPINTISSHAAEPSYLHAEPTKDDASLLKVENSAVSPLNKQPSEQDVSNEMNESELELNTNDSADVVCVKVENSEAFSLKQQPVPQSTDIKSAESSVSLMSNSTAVPSLYAQHPIAGISDKTNEHFLSNNMKNSVSLNLVDELPSSKPGTDLLCKLLAQAASAAVPGKSNEDSSPTVSTQEQPSTSFETKTDSNPVSTNSSSSLFNVPYIFVPLQQYTVVGSKSGLVASVKNIGTESVLRSALNSNNSLKRKHDLLLPPELLQHTVASGIDSLRNALNVASSSFGEQQKQKNKEMKCKESPLIKCVDCPIICASREELWKHRNEAKHDLPKEKLTRSKKKLYSPEEMVQMGYLRCAFCTIYYLNKRQLKQHLWTFHREVMPDPVCTVCAEEFQTHEELWKHKREKKHNDSYSTSTSYQCDTCGKHVSKYSSLVQHQKLFCGKSEQETEALKIFPCDECEKRFKSASIVKVHKNIVHQKSPSVCDVCGIVYKNQVALRRHKWRHDESNRKFVCHDCGKRFYKKFVLDMHIRTHTKEKPFKCPLCSYACSFKHNINKHAIAVHKTNVTAIDLSKVTGKVTSRLIDKMDTSSN